MLTNFETIFLTATSASAGLAGHIYPDMAACEAALESGFGRSTLAMADNNLFGMKQHSHPIYGTHVLPTREFEKGQWIEVDADWIHYPSTKECFQDRMATLQRLASAYPNYAKALSSPNAVQYVANVSATWSTDPLRAAKVLEIFHDWGKA